MAVAFRHMYGSDPDAVIMKSFHWDLRHIVSVFPHHYSKHSSGGTDLRIRNWTSEYRDLLEDALQHLKKTFPASIVALRTDPLWNVSSSRLGSDPSYVHHVGTHLNNIIRMLSDKHNVPLFDIFQIFEGLDPSEYLADDVHIKEHFSRVVLKIILSGISCS